ncbi:MAG: mechanosensitive ion channel, partial [Clostridium sp.]|nr:mechanosensitive ion channel [Clostridium sp.]
MQKNSKKLTAKRMVLSAVGLILLVFVLNPEWIPFLEDGKKSGLNTIIDTYTGQFHTLVESVINSSDKIIAIVLVFVVVYVVRTINALIFSCINFENRHKETLKVLLESVISYGAALIGIIVSLSILGVNMVALFASVGLASLIVGFSAQQIIYDIIAGIFLIFEGQLNVGDIVT